MKWLAKGANKPQLRAGSALGALLILVLFSASVLYADTFIQGFKAKTPLQPGIVAAISKDSSDTVQTAPSKDPTQIFGVVIDPSDSAATVNGDGQQIFVATSGHYRVLVSSENGTIKAGDYLSMSASDGVAAKAKDSQVFVLGRALEDFDGTNNVLSNQGSLAIGKIYTDVKPEKNPLVKDEIIVPKLLRRVGEAIAGKTVSAFRLYAALIIFLTTIVLVGSLLWAGVRHGMISIGRNPLSRRSILRGLTQVLMVDVLVFIIGVFGVYLLLRV